MTRKLSAAQLGQFHERGYCAPIAVMAPALAEAYRERLERASQTDREAAERVLKMKSHLVFGCLDELMRNPAILDVVEDIVGPDILVWSSSVFAKKPASPHYVSWHQDLTYWGLDPPNVVTAWLALTESNAANGCMRVVPGSHLRDVVDHRDTFAEHNLLSRGQEVAVEVDEAEAVDLVLQPGEMSLHHVKIFHGSRPNASGRPRIGFAVRYVAAEVRQVRGAADSATLLRGTDRYGNFGTEPRPAAEFDADALRGVHAEACEKARRFLFKTEEQSARW